MHRPQTVRNLSLATTVYLSLELWLAIAPAVAYHAPSERVTLAHPQQTLMAQRQKGYVPPPPRGPLGSGTTGGVRGGCSNNATLPLVALAPQQHLGQTASTRPTFAWYVPDTTSYQLVFQLFEGNATEPLYDETLNSQTGIMSWSLPEHVPPLKVGETYRWRVILLCDENRPSMNVRDTAYIVVTSPPQTVSAEMRDRDPVAYANAMAAAGFWYDALAATLAEETQPEMRSLRQTLLEDLAYFEEAATATNTHAENLRQVAAEQ